MRLTQNETIYVILLFLPLLALGTPAKNPHKIVSIPIEIEGNGILCVSLFIGTPPKLHKMMLDFQSTVSGVWETDLSQSVTFVDTSFPNTRDLVYFGPYSPRLEIRSLAYEKTVALATDSPLAYAPPRPHVDAIDGWLALSDDSDALTFWNSFELDHSKLTLIDHNEDKVGGSFLTEFERSPPNIIMKKVEGAENYKQGFLVSQVTSSHETIEEIALLTDQHPEQISSYMQMLKSHNIEKLSFVLFSNSTKTLLPQVLYDSMFYGTNLNDHASVPMRVCLLPELCFAQHEFLKHDAITGLPSLRLGYVSKQKSAEVLRSNGVSSVNPNSVVYLSLHELIERFRIKISIRTNEISFVHIVAKSHISMGYIILMFALQCLLLVILTVKVVTISLTHSNTNINPLGGLRKMGKPTFVALRYRYGGFWVLQLFYICSIGLTLFCFWGSERLAYMRTERSNKSENWIYWCTALLVNFTCLMQLSTCVLNVLTYMKRDQTKANSPSDFTIQRTLSQLFVSSNTTYINTLMISTWTVLMQRSVSISNSLTSLWCLIIVPLSTASPFILIDWLLNNRGSKDSAMWSSPTMYTQWTFYYALFYLFVSGLWSIWIIILTFYFQIYQETKGSMRSLTDSFCFLIAASTVASTIYCGIVYAKIKIRVGRARQITVEEEAHGVVKENNAQHML